jgi:hypothetical protein
MSLLGQASTAFPSYAHLLCYYHLAVQRELRTPALSLAVTSSETAVQTMNIIIWFI